MTTRKHAESLLNRVGAADDDGFDLVEAALALASLERPGVSLERYRDHLDLLAADVGRAASDAGSLRDRVAALNEVLFDTHGYEGDRRTYDDLQNANLMRVIDRRRGLPVALGILALHAGRAQGWSIVGLKFPGHFLLRAEGAGERVILDPFDRGAERNSGELRALLKAQGNEAAALRPEHYEAASDRDILLRLQNNIKLRQTQRGDNHAAARTMDVMLRIGPNETPLWHEKALLEAQLGRIDSAVAALEEYIARETRDGPRHDATLLLQKLRGQSG
ncbi:MAG: transglutaminase-like domain-containing protein [Alphaproteobacteria bacterium]